MKPGLTIVTEYAVVIIDWMALIIILVGTIAAFVATIRFILGPADNHARREIWLRYSRWLVAGLTFQLAADIAESSITSSWDAVGRLAAVAAIRTFLNYFLERDVAEIRGRESVTNEAAT
jgi:uncharacterized membrane protein